MKEKQLYRSCTNRILGGVCGGLGEYFEIDPVLIRLIFVILAFGGIGIVTYIIAWIIIPSDPSCESKKEASLEIKEKVEAVAEEIKKTVKAKDYKTSDGRLVVGLILIALGVLAFVQSVLNINLWHIFWPAILIIVGLSFLVQIRK